MHTHELYNMVSWECLLQAAADFSKSVRGVRTQVGKTGQFSSKNYNKNNQKRSTYGYPQRTGQGSKTEVATRKPPSEKRYRAQKPERK